ncbi:MAG: sugar phosphate isomerase/epimerase [Steroidobacteraceae bacterium]|jgi:sugar phosphate isomerase/epimerase
MLTRRLLLQIGGPALALSAWNSRLLAAPAAGVDLRLGVQLWTVKDELQRDYGGTLRQLAHMGVRRVELYQLGGPPAARTRRALAAAGLECISAHVRLWELDAGLQDKIERAHEIGIRTLVVPVPWLPPDALRRALAGDMLRVLAEETTLDTWKRTAELLNSYGEQLQKAGLALAYHNHNIDFRQFGDQVAYDLLVESTDAKYVRLEMDCGWVASAGRDPVVYLQRWPQRYMALHVKDVKAGFVTNVAMQTSPTEVGSGVMKWPEILQAAYTAGVREYYIEQEGPFIRPPLESVQISVDYVRSAARRLKMSS